MPGLFQALEIGKSALMSSQLSMQTTGHNIANVNTPGYTRQRVSVTTAYPERSMYGPIGTGVRVEDVQHIRDLFLGEQYRDAQKNLGQWQYKEKILTQIESLFNEPNDNSLGDQLNEFWDAWSDLSTNADSVTNRDIILSEANKLINSFHQLSRDLTSLQDSIDADLQNYTANINSLTTEIANLNQQIKRLELGDDTANDLRDTRDQLTDQLSSLIDVNTIEKDNGATVVYMGSMVLVDGSDSFAIGTKSKNVSGVQISKLVWEGTSVELRNFNGELAGLLEARDTVIPDYLDKLDLLAQSLVEGVNSLHRSGYGLDGSTGVSFFDPNYTAAATIRLNTEIEENVKKIVASSIPMYEGAGDNHISLEIADLRVNQIMEDNTVTINDYYSSLVGRLGSDVLESTSFKQNYELLANQVENNRQSVQGVSLDEESTNLIKYQHAYDAAARVITAMDQAIDVVINSMGVVGR